ncbi:uncharacterized protein EV422DRAFT_90962 [Fimicolochytrium jonesii]|uniref:uncharacterized protein n=1 Tax=Fimicolochytrium jonesii TaxID=1396493 RepID=UPI0022FE19B8|nr:uncharacterized protein EV422DRAFT_90962 [Fimicolochytrium jonesii]KAI8819899.1 hypothetical protein EV422DRAFT_90962 [Fimicolochytrium jonesii]
MHKMTMRPTSSRPDPLSTLSTTPTSNSLLPPSLPTPLNSISTNSPTKLRAHFGHHGGLHHGAQGKPDRGGLAGAGAAGPGAGNVMAGAGGDSEFQLQVKHAIIEKSPVRLNTYEPKDVATRTELVMTMKESNAARLARLQKRTEILKQGFCSDPKESYRPLGDPILDSSNLIYTALRIDPNAVQTSAVTNIAEATHDIKEIRKSVGRRTTEVSPRHNNGFSLIKGKLAKSKGRIDAVKFGIPFSQTVDDSSWRHRADAAKSRKAAASLEEGEVDWHNLKIDTDKQAYFQNVLERAIPGFISQTQKRKKTPRTNMTVARDLPREPERWGTPTHKRPLSAESANGADADHMKGADSLIGSNSSLAASATAFGGVRHKSKVAALTPKAMEQALNINRDDRGNMATDQYYTTREHFYEQQRRLTQVLLDDLNRLDFERKSHFLRKYKALKVGKNNTMFSDDIAAMRQRANAQRDAEKARALRQHPWYTELVTKVVFTGVKKHASEYEALLLGRVKCVIEDGLPFAQNTFVGLMKVIPAHEFMKDDIQRILRFVKAHASISEREYLEAIDMAGHMENYNANAQAAAAGGAGGQV